MRSGRIFFSMNYIDRLRCFDSDHSIKVIAFQKNYMINDKLRI